MDEEGSQRGSPAITFIVSAVVCRKADHRRDVALIPERVLRLEPASATSGAEAFAVLRRHRPGLILIAVNLPDIDGVEVVR